MEYLDNNSIIKILMLLPEELINIQQVSKYLKNIIEQNEVLNYIIKYGIDENAYRIYAVNDKLTLLKYMYRIYNIIPEDIIEIVVRFGYLDCLKFLIKNFNRKYSIFFKNRICSYASFNGHLECLKYLKENKFPITNETIYSAAKNGQLECLKYSLQFIDDKTRIGNVACNNAVIKGYLDCLKLSCENGCPCDGYTFGIAAAYGHLECLKYLHSIKCPSLPTLCQNAAEGGHLECLKYLHNVGYPIQFKNNYELRSFIVKLIKDSHKECATYVLEHYVIE
jgi:hypothetical protein